MSNANREAYVKWRESLGISVSSKTTVTPEFVWDSAWQAALQHDGEPVAVAEKGVLNWIDGKQFDREADLYTHPQPAAIESLASWMLSRGFSTGHGESVTDLLAELDGQIDDLLSAGKEKTE